MGQLPQIRPNPVKILAGAGFGRISKKSRMPDLPEPEPKSGTSLVLAHCKSEYGYRTMSQV